MGIQQYVQGEELKKLIEDKLISTSSAKYILAKKGIIPICVSTNSFADLIYRMFIGSDVMSQMHEVMNFEQNNLKSTMLILNPKLTTVPDDFTAQLVDEITELQRIPNTPYKLKNLHRDNDKVFLQYCYDKPQKGRVSMASTKTVTLDVNITNIDNNQFKVNIRHEGMSDSKQFISLLDNMLKDHSDTDKIFSIKRITLKSLLKANKVDFFDNFGSLTLQDWKLIDITNVTVNKNERVIDEEEEDDSDAEEISENEPTGRLTGISTAILRGGGLRNNDFVKECMNQGFIFSSMVYKFEHRTLPTVIEIEINFKQTDLKISIVKTYRIEDDGKNITIQLPVNEQNDIIDYFQNKAYNVYQDLINQQRTEIQVDN